nr:putative F-box protein At1g19160 [Ipomoea batatas]
MLCLILGRGDSIMYFSDGTDFILDILIWNPFTRETKNLPSAKVPGIEKCVNYEMNEGFGFGLSKNMSWKIVMLWYYECRLQRTDSYEFVMVCSQIGDGSWGWRQIDEVPHVPVHFDQSFYLKGRYYWRSGGPTIDWRPGDPIMGRLVWFDFSDEIFGIIEFPSYCKVASVTIMNDEIALLSYSGYAKVGDCIEIWLMNENDGNIDWHKHASIECTRSIEYHKYWSLKGNWDEVWKPIGIWKLGGRDHLLLVLEQCYSTHSDENARGMVLLAIGNDEEAIEKLQKIQQLSSSSIIVRGGYAETLCLQQNRKAEGERIKLWAESAWKNPRLSLAEALEPPSESSSKVALIDTRICRVI